MNSKQANHTIDRMMDMLGEGNFPDAIDRDNCTLGTVKDANRDIKSGKAPDAKKVKDEISDANFMCKKLVNAIKKVFTCTSAEEIENIPEIDYIRSRSELDSDALTLLCTQIENTVSASDSLVDSIKCVEVDPKLYGMLSNLNKSLIDLLKYRAQLICDLKDEYENIMSEVVSRQGMAKKKSPNAIITSIADSVTSQEPSKESTKPKEETSKEEQNNTPEEKPKEDNTTNPPESTLSIPEDYKVDDTNYNTQLDEAAIEKTSDELEGVVFSSSKELMALINDEHAR